MCRRVRDGTSKTWYQSGFHVFWDRNDAMHYLEKFKNRANKCIVRCRVRRTHTKAHSPSPVILAEHMLIEGVVWRADAEYWRESCLVEKAGLPCSNG